MSWLPGTVLKREDQTGNSSHIPVTFIQVFKISRALNKKVDFKGHFKGTLSTPTFQTRTNRVAYPESGADAGDWALRWGRAVVHAQAEGRRTRHRTPRHHVPACSVPHTSGESAASAASWERAERAVSRQRTPHGFLWPAVRVTGHPLIPHLFSRRPFPVSRKPLAKGLLSIFSCVICGTEEAAQSQDRALLAWPGAH